MKVIKKITGSLKENSYIIMSEDLSAVIVDPGSDEEELIKTIRDLNLNLKGILVTHSHFDHIGAVDAMREAFAAESYVPLGEKEMILDPVANLSAIYLGRECTAQADHLVDGGQVLDFGSGLSFETILVPGHSPYSICYYNREFGCVFCGDTLFRQGIGRVDLYEGDQGDLIKYIKERLLTLPEETVVYAGHGLNTTIGNEKAANPYLSEEGFWLL